MASLPPSQRPPASSQRSSPPSSSPLSSPGSNREEGPSTSSTTETVLLNPNSLSSHQNESEEAGVGPVERPLGQRTDSVSVRRCWICYSDETEDTPLSSAWRSPCPCALTAHESCLLDWVADIEGSNGGRSRKILCPQCKSEIFIARPRSILVDLVKGIEGAASRMVLPSIIIIGSTTVVYLSLSYGAIAVHLVLGTDDFQKIFGSAVYSPAQVLRRLFGLSIVPWMLILSRTSIADSILPIVPMLFFVTQPKPDPLVDFSSWPPSAGLSFALLPYLRAAYNAYYEYVWGDKVRRWIEEVKPRSTSDSQRNGGDLELEIGLEDEEDESDDEEAGDNARPAAQQEQADHEARGPAHPLHAPPMDHQEHAAPPPPPQRNLAQGEVRVNAAIGAHAGQQGAAAAAAQDIVQHRRRDYSISVSRVAQSVLGALVFPGISAMMGDLLRVVLPTSWTFVGSRWQKPTRFLQTRWGRSIVGGCLFVVLKDAVTLYVRWKMAQNHRKRKVVDYDKSKAKRRVSQR